MPDTQKIINVLSEYKGDMDSLNTFVSVAEAEFGSDWTLRIQSDLSDLPVGLKGKLDHACNYYGATVAWNEIQEYLNDEHLNVDDVADRIPVLDYWLKFFGQSGKDVIVQLEQKIQALKDAQSATHQLVEPILEQTDDSSEMVQEIQPAELNNNIEQNETVQEQQTDASVQSIQEKVEQAFPSEQLSETEKSEDAHLNNVSEMAQVGEPDMPATENDAESVESAVLTEKMPEMSMETDPFENTFEQEEAPEMPKFFSESPAILDETVVADEVSVDTQLQTSAESLKEEDIERFKRPTTPDVAQPVVFDEPMNVVEEQSQMPDQPVVSETPAVLQEETLQKPVFKEDLSEAKPLVETPDSPVLVIKEEFSEQDPDLFILNKIDRQLDFLHQAQAWISARCVELGNIEPHTYTYYGFLMDVYQQTVRDIQSVLTDPNSYAVVQQKRPEAIKRLKDTEVVLKSELDFSKDLFNPNPAPLIDQNMSADDARQALGNLDTSTYKEYLGPAPDGFEMLDDPYETESGELDEDKIKSDYEKIEDGADVQLPEIADRVEPIIQKNASQDEKNLANSPKKGVEKKMSISLGVKPLRKKVKIETTDTE